MAPTPSVILGSEMPFVSVLWRKNSASSVAIDCYGSNGLPADLGAAGIRSVVIERDNLRGAIVSYTAVISGSRAQWNFSSAQTNVSWARRDARLVFNTDTDRFVVGDGEVRV